MDSQEDLAQLEMTVVRYVLILVKIVFKFQVSLVKVTHIQCFHSYHPHTHTHTHTHTHRVVLEFQEISALLVFVEEMERKERQVNEAQLVQGESL